MYMYIAVLHVFNVLSLALTVYIILYMHIDYVYT